MSYRYIGNKTRLLPVLMEEISALVPRGSVVADVMCGTASVSEALRVSGYRVVASDIMTFAAHHARVRLLMDSTPTFEGLGTISYMDVQKELDQLPPVKGLFVREYSPEGSPANGEKPRMYFSTENAARLDAMNQRINLWHGDGKLSQIENSLLRHDLILAANRVANIAGTYGHYRSKWSNGSTTSITLRLSEIIFNYPTNHIVMQGAAEDVAHKIDADLCYIDPPYMKRQYAANYHIIETLARGDEPQAVGVSGLRPWRDQYSDFCSKLKIRNSFRRIFFEMNCDQFLISYSEDGLLAENEMLDLFREFGEVSLKKIPFKRFKSNVGGEGGTVSEYLFYLRKM